MLLLTETPAIMPRVVPLEEPPAFTRSQLDGLIQQGLSHEASTSPEFQRILARIVTLRRDHVAWVFGLPLARLIPRRAAQLSSTYRIAPLTIFKIKAGQWIPKIVIYLTDEFSLDHASLVACHAACRTAGIECMCLTTEHLARGYLDSKDFKRAFNGTFFCDPHESNLISCPTLRSRGITAWPATQRPATTFYH